MRRLAAPWVVVALLGLRCGILPAQTPTASVTTESESPRALALAAMAGEQFWSDELVYQGWRIQQHALANRYRLIDRYDVRRKSGTYDECRAALEEAKRREMLPPLSGKAVVTLHGLTRLRDHMHAIGSHLTKNADYHWVNVSYASTRRSLDEHAQSLASVIDGLEGIEEIHFVCHSLGNLVVRRYLGEAQRPEPKWKPDPRITRMVMLGPPNNGAQFAELFKNNELLGLVAGPSGKQIGREWNETQRLLATPAFPFGILAGGRGDARGINPLVDGDDDLLVAVDETRLPGACDFRLVPCWHGGLLDDETVRQCVACFLAHGYFTSEGERQPISATAAAPPGGAEQP